MSEYTLYCQISLLLFYYNNKNRSTIKWNNVVITQIDQWYILYCEHIIVQEREGMARRHAKTAQGKHYPVSLLKSTISLES